MLQDVIDLCTSIVERGGYEGIFIGMFLEGTIVPLPIEEILLPFAGFLSSSGALSFWMVVIVGSSATTFGNVVSYYIARWLGTPFLDRYGKYFFIRGKDIERAHSMLEKHGAVIVFFVRFVPGVRGIMPFIAGASQMNVVVYSTFTFAGSFVYVLLFVLLGWYLGDKWEESVIYTQYISYGVLALVLLGLVYVFYKLHKRTSLRERIRRIIKR